MSRSSCLLIPTIKVSIYIRLRYLCSFPYFSFTYHSPSFFTGSESRVKHTLSSLRIASSLCPSLAQWNQMRPPRNTKFKGMAYGYPLSPCTASTPLGAVSNNLRQASSEACCLNLLIALDHHPPAPASDQNRTLSDEQRRVI